MKEYVITDELRDNIIKWFNNIAEEADSLTTGNVSETGSVTELVWNDRMKMLDCKFLNGAKVCFDIPFGTFVARYKRIVVLMSKFDKEK